MRWNFWAQRQDKLSWTSRLDSGGPVAMAAAAEDSIPWTMRDCVTLASFAETQDTWGEVTGQPPCHLSVAANTRKDRPGMLLPEPVLNFGIRTGGKK